MFTLLQKVELFILKIIMFDVDLNVKLKTHSSAISQISLHVSITNMNSLQNKMFNDGRH